MPRRCPPPSPALTCPGTRADTARSEAACWPLQARQRRRCGNASDSTSRTTHTAAQPRPAHGVRPAPPRRAASPKCPKAPQPAPPPATGTLATPGAWLRCSTAAAAKQSRRWNVKIGAAQAGGKKAASALLLQWQPHVWLCRGRRCIQPQLLRRVEATHRVPPRHAGRGRDARKATHRRLTPIVAEVPPRRRRGRPHGPGRR